MQTLPQKLLLLLALAAIASATVASADYEAGRLAATRGDFAVAFREWRPLAERGNPQAQYGLGRMYARGDGVRKDFRSALQWFTSAAAGGEPRALFALGKMYEFGDGVGIDKALARKYYEQARAAGIPEAAERLKQLGALPLATATPRTVGKPPSKPAEAATTPVAAGDQAKPPVQNDDPDAPGIAIFMLFVAAVVIKKIFSGIRKRLREAFTTQTLPSTRTKATRTGDRPLATSKGQSAPLVPTPAMAAEISSLPPPKEGPDWNPYSVLKVRPSATRDEIERAYKRLIASDRPEHYSGMSETVARLAKSEAARIRRAYAELTRQ